MCLDQQTNLFVLHYYFVFSQHKYVNKCFIYLLTLPKYGLWFVDICEPGRGQLPTLVFTSSVTTLVLAELLRWSVVMLSSVFHCCSWTSAASDCVSRYLVYFLNALLSRAACYLIVNMNAIKSGIA